MPLSAKFIRKLDKLQPDLKAVLLDLLAEIEKQREASVSQEQFQKFAQATHENFQNVWKAIGELTKAQQRTEKRVEELAKAQERTERTVNKLAIQLEENTKQLGGISNTIGYGLEDKSFPLLQKALKEQFNIKVDELYRTNLRYSHDKYDEINIYGEGRRNGDIIYVIGKSKAQFGPKEVRSFLKLIERVKDHLEAPVFSLALSYHYHPNAEDELKEAGIPYFWSFKLNKYAS